MEHPAKYDAVQIADWFIERGRRDGNRLTVGALLKLAYIAHGWHLAMFDWRPLFNNRIEAWPNEPVVVDIYTAFREQWEAPEPSRPRSKEEMAEISDFLEQVYAIYGDMSSGRLSSLTRVRGGPWDRVARWGYRFAEIHDHLIAMHYTEKMRRSENERYANTA